MLMKLIASTSFPLYNVKNTWKSVHPFQTYDSTDRQKGTEFLKIGRSSKQIYFLLVKLLVIKISVNFHILRKCESSAGHN